MELTPEDGRLTTFPENPARASIWAIYKKMLSCLWTVEEVIVIRDKVDYMHKLSEAERRLIKYILAFFAASDGIVNMNLIERFRAEFPVLEVRYAYDLQIAMENIHAEMYSILLVTIVPDPDEQKHLLSAATSMPVIKDMTTYMYNCIGSKESLAARILRMICVEGIFFTGCFCAIYWFQSRGLMPGLGQSNEFIARDEGLHTQLAIALYLQLNHRLDAPTAQNIVVEAVHVAKTFINDALPKGLTEMSAELMTKYIQCVADNILSLLHYPLYFNSRNPFSFMEQINMNSRTNFFERRNTHYQKAEAPRLSPIPTDVKDDLEDY